MDRDRGYIFQGFVLLEMIPEDQIEIVRGAILVGFQEVFVLDRGAGVPSCTPISSWRWIARSRVGGVFPQFFPFH